jgi:hypothetical protein
VETRGGSFMRRLAALPQGSKRTASLVIASERSKKSRVSLLPSATCGQEKSYAALSLVSSLYSRLEVMRSLSNQLRLLEARIQ